MEFDPRPIGVFDSGLGGITVLSELKNHFPDENFIYLGDTARLPYGTKSPETIRQYGLQIMHFLLKRGVKAIVVACNSASTQIQEKQIGITPVYNVIDPGARAALMHSSTKRIGILGTRATVLSEAYPRAIRALDESAVVLSQACPLFVPLAEEGWVDDPITNLIAYRYVQPLVEQGIDSLVLGCTHYPILKSAVTKVTGTMVALVDSGEAICNQLYADFKDGKIKANQKVLDLRLELLTTDYSLHLAERAQSIAAPHQFTKIEKVDL